ncbi:SIMPL domain-containing protein [Polyangium aurulentum]|uniref:SIMPL domain-containing protein n=1 Tax=Polyangium aurulentum TaxID=2567896 RepID=UPI0010AEB6D5|nr:SIMPL domain-containing protein [Polyangium aurulentum]UQA61638.1 SIMPL domain-containing protein [Polyangium aurulentum]
MRMGSFVALAWLVPAALGLVGCAAEPSGSSAMAPHEVVRSITVVGRGEATGKPDIARTSLGVEASAATVEEALNQTNAQMTRIMDAVKKVGVAEKDIKTANFSIQVERPFQPPQPMPMPEPMPGPAKATKGGAAASPPPPAPPSLPPATYRVSNQVEITIREVDKASRVLQAAVNAGANSVWNVSFAIDDTKALEAEARDKAVADARTRAEALARLSGMKLGPVISVSEVIGRGPVPQMPMFRGDVAMAAKMGGGAPPLEGGEMMFGTSIEVVFGLEK